MRCFYRAAMFTQGFSCLWGMAIWLTTCAQAMIYTPIFMSTVIDVDIAAQLYSPWASRSHWTKVTQSFQVFSCVMFWVSEATSNVFTVAWTVESLFIGFCVWILFMDPSLSSLSNSDVLLSGTSCLLVSGAGRSFWAQSPLQHGSRTSAACLLSF